MKVKNKMRVMMAAVAAVLCLSPAAVFASDGPVTRTDRQVGIAEENTDEEKSDKTENTAYGNPDEAEKDTSDSFTEDEEMGEMLESIFGLMMSGLEDTEASEPLTPEGNLTLVDDIRSANGEGKQFITVMTKKGNYFYIIIDRDKEGEGTVHFLNQVDEADLFHLMDEEAQEEYISQMTEPEEPEIQESEPEEPEEEEPEPEPEPEKRMINIKGLMGIAGILVITISGGVYFIIQKMKKKKTESKPDPDDDYFADEENEEEYLTDDSYESEEDE